MSAKKKQTLQANAVICENEITASSSTSNMEDLGSTSYADTNSEKDPTSMECRAKLALLEAGVGDNTIELVRLCGSLDEYCSIGTYSLRKRVSTNCLLIEFAKKVSSAERIFTEMITDANLFLSSNYHGARAMDKDLKSDSEYLSNPLQQESMNEAPREEVMRQKDGTKRLECPLLNCSVNTFRLKRHLVDCHANLTGDQVKFGMKMAMIIARNKETPDDVKTTSVSNVKRETGMKGDPRTNMASRKYNLKRCELCTSLQFNMTSHLKSTHKMTRDTHPEQYDSLIRECEVIPKCYTRKINNRHVMLDGEDLSNAIRENESTVEEHADMNNNLKSLREARDELFRKRNLEMDADERIKLDLEWKKADEKYKALRYKDARVYSERVLVWKNSFSDYLRRRAYNNTARYVTMALDVVLSYEETMTFTKLSNPKIVRQMLESFKGKPKITSTSKLKYLGMFKHFIKFLFLDIDSPECGGELTSSQMASKEYKFKLIEHEIESMIQILTRDKGSDLILTKEKAIRKLIEKKDVEMLRDTISESLCAKFDDLSNVIKDGSMESKLEMAVKIRDELIAIATVRLCRRSKELIKLKIGEVKKAKLRNLPNGSSYHMIEVQDHKNTRSGVPATIAYTQLEFKILNLFIEHFRAVLTNGEETEIVFPNQIKPSNRNIELSFADLHYILSKFKTSSGKTFTSRSIRGSAVTNFQKNETCEKTRRDMAVSMGHTLAVQQKNYNYERTTDACARILNDTVEQSAMHSEVSELCDADTINFSDISLQSPVRLIEEIVSPQILYSPCDSNLTVLTPKRVASINKKSPRSRDLAGPSSSSTPMKSLKRSATDSALDKTLQNLRSKKIKSTMSVQQLRDELISALGRLNDDSRVELFTKKGNVSIKPLKKFISPFVFENFTNSEIKKQLGIIELHRVLTE